MSALAVAFSLAVGHPPVRVERPACWRLACQRRVARKHRRRVVAPFRPWLERTAACETGGDWSTNTGNGFYGGLQFTLPSWRAVGGVGYPHKASKLTQMYRGVLLLKAQGAGAWPVCGH
jgi:hypothetical protein